jgi:hypothetical protein
MRSVLAAGFVVSVACAPDPRRPTSFAPEDDGPDAIAISAEGDSALEHALREAVRLDGDGRAPVEQKIRAWQTVQERAGDGSIAEQATARVELWSRAAEAAQRRPERLERLAAHYERDVAKVRQGAIRVEEFCEGYASHTKELLELRVDPPYAEICTDRPKPMGLVPER